MSEGLSCLAVDAGACHEEKMTFRRTIIVSILCHSLVLCAALVFIRNVQIQERTILVEIRTSGPEEDAGKGELKRLSRVETVTKTPVSAPGKKVSPQPLSEKKHAGNKADELMKEKAEEHGHAGIMPARPSVPHDAVQSAGSGVGQGGAGAGAEGVSIYMNGSSGSPGSASAFGSGVNPTQLIREAIERAKVYPELARKRRQEGVVVTEFSINAHGLPENIRVTKSSGFSLLDSAARDTILKAAPFPVVEGRIEIPINFILK
jgi:TonB family protein